MTDLNDKNLTSEQSHKRIAGFFIGGLVLGGLLTSGIFIAKQHKNPADISSVVGAPFIKVDGKTYSTTELPGDAAMEYYMLQNSIFNAEQTFANQVALRIALAKDAQKPISDKELPKINDLLAVGEVSDLEAKQYYDKVVAQMGTSVFGGQSFEQIKDQLKKRMNQQKSTQAVSTKVQELQAGKRIAFLLKAPTAPSVTLDISAYPVRGDVSSSTTVVEVADYLCPHCRDAQPSMESLYKEFGAKVKFVHVSYPLAPEGLSGALARGAFCANKQGSDKFWKYHTLAFQVPWEKNQVPTASEPTQYYNSVTSEVAQTAGLDSTAFNSCLTSEAATRYVKDTQSAFNESKGFQGTPTFYLNNKVIQSSPEQLESTLRAALSQTHS